MTPRLDWAEDGRRGRGKWGGGGEAGLRLKTANPFRRPRAADSEGGQIDSYSNYNAVPSTFIVLSLGVPHRMHQGHRQDQDGTSRPPQSAVAGTILFHFIDKESSVIELPSRSP